MPTYCPLVGRPTETIPTPYGRDGYRIVRCVETGFVFLENPPAYDEVRDDFPWEQTIVVERRRRRQAEPVVARLSDAVKWVRRRLAPRRNHAYAVAARCVAAKAEQSVRLLDVGCGSGHLAVDCCERFAGAGRDATPIGLELSPALARTADERFAVWGGAVIAAPALEGLGRIAERSIDVALLISFLEHDQRPLDLLRGLRPKLAPGGGVVVKAPNFASVNRRLRGNRWCGFRYPDHVNYFTPATLERLALEAGYTVEAPRRGDRPFLGDNLYAVLRPAGPQSASHAA
jgi:SAM-dependent methyltransferase